MIAGQPARMLIFVLLAIALPLSADTRHLRIRNSLLLLIDTSGSMSSEIGDGNPEIKIEAAKDAAVAAIDRALANGATEVAALAFEGECDNPISQVLDFTTDVDQLTSFIHGLQPGGGTPMADAVLAANRFMQDSGTPDTHSQMIVLLADGDNDCGDVAQAMDQLRAAGIVFRHETVGFGIAPTSHAARDLRHVAQRQRRPVPSRHNRHAARRRIHGVRRHVYSNRHVGHVRRRCSGKHSGGRRYRHRIPPRVPARLHKPALRETTTREPLPV